MEFSELFQTTFFKVGVVLILLCIVGAIIEQILRSPFKYPYFEKRLDVSGRRKPQMTELIDEYLVENRMDEIDAHRDEVDQWKYECQQKIEKSPLHNLREKQFKEALDDIHAYRFVLFRKQTRYKQENHVKHSYQVETDVESQAYDYGYLANRNARLSKIDYETTLKKYNSKQQRKLMTPQLRKQIMERDNYTCQKCGKYMPDEVGIEVDHIIPIAKGGKTVPSNLQVLCSKCNGSKHDKV